MLAQLLYVSNRNSNCTQEEIDNILAACKKNNPPLYITGVLLYSERKFIQLVEGDFNTLMTLYDKIKIDHRHSEVMMISCSPIKEKSFPSWHMATKKIGAETIDYSTDMTEQDKAFFDEMLLGNESDGKRVIKLLKTFLES
ncbi:MAG: BLUF domain-containing protein [Bernardetiaceae bacterium]|nr:BLUF domain-containing protein [Bernardetiaceae bacterium]